MAVWTDDKIAILEAGWRAGDSTPTIAARLGDGFTKMAVIGKAHRLGLNSHTNGHAPATPRRARPLAELQLVNGAICVWPIGDPGSREFRFCGGAPLPGKPYCGEHYRRAYRKGAES